MSLNANLNSIEPMPKPKDKLIPAMKPIKQSHICEVCSINCYTLKQLEVHNETKKHNKNVTNNKLIEKGEPKETAQIIYKFVCEKCDYTTSNKKDYNKHMLTPKHNNANATIKSQCLCGKTFNHCSSLYRHKKKCAVEVDNCEPNEEPKPPNNELVAYLMNENKELKGMIMEVCKNNSATNNSNYNVNSIKYIMDSHR